MCRFANSPNDAMFGCTCHLGPDLPEHEHTIYVTLKVDAVAFHNPAYPEEMDEDERNDCIRRALNDAVTDLKFKAKSVSKIFHDIEEEYDDCPCCSKLDYDDAPDCDDRDD